MSVSWIFPGQGSQNVGMGKNFLEKFPQYTNFFDIAERVTEKPLREYIWNETPEFTQTDVIQPSIYTIECMIAKSLLDKGEKPIMVAGHSLGEYAALFASGYISFEQGLELLKYRGAAMQKACEKAKSGMIACIFPNDPENFEKAAKLAKETGCEVANFNSYEQIVLSGGEENIADVAARYKDFGATKAIKLNVAGAYHSSFMKEAADEFAEKIKDLEFKTGNITLICNRTAKPLEDVKQNMIDQIYSPVYWQQTIQHMQPNCQQFLEIGPGMVLSKMLKRQSIEASVMEF